MSTIRDRQPPRRNKSDPSPKFSEPHRSSGHSAIAPSGLVNRMRRWAQDVPTRISFLRTKQIRKNERTTSQLPVLGDRRTLDAILVGLFNNKISTGSPLPRSAHPFSCRGYPTSSVGQG
ncbi:hypothetical protein V495_04479 [Pseudogymnoascus sp. VKM F-4514 (FW-929)]|nr:hypothetical protein V490_08044 [Pseudogymnoascus sp. VKM F-3557]KFY42490.1 hypothetical protein V495_04479 [Pseudogymnoascus sp. VKM F-4514 (FW-929)]KFY54711.1 hypothetical protein V497_07489 [Pseudogymnoascus sp. VKM F-4516 (FW-969)]